MRFTLSAGVVDAEVAWTVLSDTDAMNRAAGNSAVVSTVEQTPDGPVMTGELLGPMGMRMPFRETGGWVDRRWFRQERVFQSGPVSRSLFELHLEPVEDGVRPELRLTLEGPLAFRPLVSASARRIRVAWQAILDALPPPGGPRARTVEALPADLQHALTVWRATLDDARIADALEGWLATGSPLELQSMRAFQLADQWGLDRHAVLVGLLRAVPAGVVELYWSVRCSRCQGEVAASTTLSDLADHDGCASCGITFDNDLAANVEVLFAPHPGLLPRVEQSFCSWFPAASPEIKGVIVVPAGGTVHERIVVGAGPFTLGVGQATIDVVAASTGPSELHWTLGDDAPVTVAAGAVELVLHNPSATTQRVTLISADPGIDRVPASLLTTLAEFRREMSDQVLGTDVRLSTRSVTLLFTDLSGSTAMFEALGDARAYGLVAEHFRLLQTVVDEHHGALVKTIGDAVMASFHRTPDAVDAALAMRRVFDAWMAEQDVSPAPRLNIGVHVGPALVVHSTAHGLDYFGRTVNLAARAQGASSDGEITFTDAALAHPTVAERLAGLPLVEVVHDLKGIGAVRLRKLPR